MLAQPPFTVQTETDEGKVPELHALMHDHWRELAEDRHLYDLDVDEALYLSIHHKGSLHVTTVRDLQGGLIAYHFVAMRRHPHRKVLAASDLISFVHPDAPNRVWVLMAMYRHSIAALKARGVRYIGFRVKLKRDFGILLRRLGFEPCEMLYTLTVRDGHDSPIDPASQR